ncbi:MAG TPA: hypothetical protein VFG69_08845 [Nannocystaceae bacterium]|nr:hypothetical protein [Nannocystaceae bacterium]
MGAWRSIAFASAAGLACSPGGDAADEPSSAATSDGGDGRDADTGDGGAAMSSAESSSGGAASEGGGESDAASDGGGSTTAGEMPPPDAPRWELLIRGDTYPRLVIEVDYVAGREPRPLVIADIEATFFALLDKPGGVEVVLDEVVASSDPEHAWTVQERLDLAIATDNLVVDDDTIKIHAMFVDGHAEEDAMGGVILGSAWGYESITIFRDSLDAGCEGAVVGPLLDQLCADAEFLIWQHEIGHVIGLVDGGLPMVHDHLDPAANAGRHDVAHDCVMYRSYEGLDAFDAVLDRLLTGGPAIEFDAQCIADITAVRDGGA